MIATHIRHSFLCALVALSFSVVCCTPQAQAGSIDPSKIPAIVVQSDGNANTKIFIPSASAYAASGADGDYALSNQMDLNGIPTASVTVQQLEFNNDPFVLNNFLVTNNLATAASVYRVRRPADDACSAKYDQRERTD